MIDMTKDIISITFRDEGTVELSMILEFAAKVMANHQRTTITVFVDEDKPEFSFISSKPEV